MGEKISYLHPVLLHIACILLTDSGRKIDLEYNQEEFKRVYDRFCTRVRQQCPDCPECKFMGVFGYHRRDRLGVFRLGFLFPQTEEQLSAVTALEPIENATFFLDGKSFVVWKENYSGCCYVSLRLESDSKRKIEDGKFIFYAPSVSDFYGSHLGILNPPVYTEEWDKGHVWDLTNLVESDFSKVLTDAALYALELTE